MQANTGLFNKLQNAPPSMFKNITPQEQTGQERPENGGTGQGSAGTTGEVQESDVLAGLKDAEIGVLDGNTAPTAQPGGNQPLQQPGRITQSLGNLISAGTAIGIVDSVLPALAVVVMQYAFDLKVQKRDLQLNEGERKIISPVLQNYLNTVQIPFDSPLMALLITVGAVYGSKFAEKGFTAYFDKRDAENENRKQQEEIRKALRTQVVEKPAPVIDINKDAINELEPDKNEFGYTKEQMQAERRLLVKQGKSPNNKSVAASIRRKEQS